MQEVNTGEGQRRKTVECLNAASLERSEGSQSSGLWGLERCSATAASEYSFMPALWLNRLLLLLR